MASWTGLQFAIWNRSLCYREWQGYRIRLERSGGFGNYVVIDHGYGYQSTYGHLSNIKVTRGAEVKRGDLIGLTGSSGLSSGPHLHYQIDFYGQHQNPLHFFNDDLTPDEYYEMISLLTSSKKF